MKTCSSAKSIPCPEAPDSSEISLSRKGDNGEESESSGESETEREGEEEEEDIESGVRKSDKEEDVVSEEKCSDEAAKKEVGGGRVSRGRSGGRKYFRRSRASVQVDDPIEEEDEEAVEAEKIEVVFSPPPFEIRSILKQRKEVLEEEMGATASTAAIDAATLSPELFLGETRERREPKPKPKAKAKKTVAFADAPVVVAESPGGGGAFSPLSLTSSPSASSSDDEWTGYDKVVVSHNLAEEILDEIYGKLEDNKEKEETSECDAATSVIYEDVAAVALDTKALAEAAAAEAAKKKTMADEILDELYGVSAAAAAASKSPATASPSRSPKSGRSRDDSLLPDNTGSASALMMGKFTASG